MAMPHLVQAESDLAAAWGVTQGNRIF